MNSKEIKLELRDIIKNRLDLELDGPEPDDDDNLFEDWGIDSIDVIDLVLAIEQEFGVKVKQGDDDVSKHFESINKLGDYIHTQIAVTA